MNQPGEERIRQGIRRGTGVAGSRLARGHGIREIVDGHEPEQGGRTSHSSRRALELPFTPANGKTHSHTDKVTTHIAAYDATRSACEGKDAKTARTVLSSHAKTVASRHNSCDKCTYIRTSRRRPSLSLKQRG